MCCAFTATGIQMINTSGILLNGIDAYGFLTTIFLLQLIYIILKKLTYFMATMSPFVTSTDTITGKRLCKSTN